ncbi:MULTISPECIES: type III pantothenate kinase [Hyphomonas]|uniref:Type III pantothenate kinase n=2 Tax=Hyphomonas adhaerens TaxID=81029 RepID=A0A069E104_9PROT|nr:MULTISPECIES: type III pantothenate kinase [Hyphomonas]KCZ83366.1 pantothenate kinase [Hyphomonas adhaerens MHS-3]MBB38620.1 type III pantothenate kinase [Hyphomonas sp.]HAE26815.1 type III pantothenate kinase [Hyphomonas adhaerens]|tara:strand:- start:7248 stop:8015 length:768 start_codon:yes stop_codon:yes gene_type:complete
MLLAIDVGNTNTVFGIHDDNTWVNQWRSATDPTKTADDHAAWLWRLADMHGADLSQINGCVISTVVPQAVFNFRNLARRYLHVEPMFIGDPDLKTGMEIRISRPEQVGADRIVSALGAHKQYSGNLIVIDSGTATTFDVVAEDGAFEGGIISPGVNLSVKALHDAAAQLPRIAIQRPAHVIGHDTISAMQSGVFWGYIDLIDGLVNRIKKEYGKPMSVVATGGVAALFEGASETIDHYDQDLLIRGLLEIYRLNK